MKRVEILGTDFDRITMDEALECAAAYLGGSKPHLIVTANPETVMLARTDQLLAEIMKRADLVVADGIGVVWASRVLGRSVPERIPGIELAERILAKAAAANLRVFLLGSTPGTAEQAAVVLQEKFNGLQIVGAYHGYFKPGPEEEAVVAKIKKSRPQLLLAALGVPRQEKWLAANLGLLEVPLGVGVGGSFNVWAGIDKRAPRWIRKIHLEWLYRLIRQPRRIRRMIALPRFVGAVFLAKICGRR